MRQGGDRDATGMRGMRLGCDGDVTGMQRDVAGMRQGCDRDATGMRWGCEGCSSVCGCAVAAAWLSIVYEGCGTRK